MDIYLICESYNANKIEVIGALGVNIICIDSHPKPLFSPFGRIFVKVKPIIKVKKGMMEKG